MLSDDALYSSLKLDPVGPGRFVAAPTGTGPAFGGQLMAQTIVAALADQPAADDPATKTVKTLHTVFARGMAAEAPVEIEVDPLHSGRSFGSCTVTLSQGGRACVRSMVLLSATEPDFILHAGRAPEVPGAADVGHDDDDEGAWQVRIVGDVDISDPDAVGPPELDVWTRFPGAPDDPVTSQALLAYATDGFLIGTAMRPHAGVGQSQAHVTLATGVISHTLTFHEPFSASQWMLLAQRSTYAGHGRCYGRGDVFRGDGVLAASFVQDAMIRPMGKASHG